VVVVQLVFAVPPPEKLYVTPVQNDCVALAPKYVDPIQFAESPGPEPDASLVKLAPPAAASSVVAKKYCVLGWGIWQAVPSQRKARTFAEFATLEFDFPSHASAFKRVLHVAFAPLRPPRLPV
jgi:hypothetical protein